MFRSKIAAVAAGLLAAGAIAASAPAANASSSGHYSQWTGGLQCNEFVTDDGNGGRLSVEMQATETRADVEHFRGAYSRTRLIAQELDYQGNWVTVKRGPAHTGVPVVSNVSGGVATSNFFYRNATDDSPRFGIKVAGQDDLFRVIVRTRIFSDEDARLALLDDYQGSCRL